MKRDGSGANHGARGAGFWILGILSAAAQIASLYARFDPGHFGRFDRTIHVFGRAFRFDAAMFLGTFAVLASLGTAFWFSRFMTRRLRDERRLRDSERFARSTVEALPTNIAIIDGLGTTLSTNRAWREFAAANGDHAKLVRDGVNYLALCDASAGRGCGDAAAFAAGIRSVAAGKTDEFTLEYACHVPANRSTGVAELRRWFLGRVTPFPGDIDRADLRRAGRVPLAGMRLVVSHSNITARKLAEEEVQRAKETAEGANVSKSAFLANTSHEIRTPMTAIMGYAEMLLDPRQSPDDRAYCARTIWRNGEHLLAIINDILDISKIEAEKVTVERLTCDLPQLVADVVGLTRPWAMKKGLSFDVVFDGVIPRTIQTDPLRAKQVLVNLVNNAIKFTHQGAVTLRVFRDITYFGHTIRFEISDSGIGMTPEQLAKLFQPFTQADVSTTRKYGGTGLGLTISKRLANLLGGDITVAGESGLGSTFTFTLNGGAREGIALLENFTADQLATVRDAESADEVQLRGRILLAEDGEDNQDLLGTHLRRAGAEVVIASNGRIAVDAALATASGDGAGRFDLILMDMQMPELDGYGATRALREAGLDIPIIALTANAMAEDRVKCLDAGCTDYLSKPISRATLLHTVARHLQLVGAPIAGNVVVVDHADDADASSAWSAASAPQHTAQLSANGVAEPLRSKYVDEPRVQKLLERFIARLPERVNTLQSLIRSNSLDELRSALHNLKGAGGSYGFPPISDLAARAEQHVREQAAMEAIHGEVQSLIEMVRRVEGYDRGKEASSGPPVG